MMRFATVSAVAGAVDYVLAAALILCRVPPFIALLVSITIVGGVSFIVHNVWTFRTAGASRRRARLLSWAILVGLSLALRYVVFQGAERILPGGEVYRLVALSIAFAISAATNYLVSRYIVFSDKP